MVYKLTSKLSVGDSAYIAGLIDGEGTITLTRKHANENRRVAITISCTERQILEFVLSCTDAGRITNMRRSRENHPPSFTYAIYNRQALTLLDQVTPFLRSYKKIRSQLILDSCLKLTPRNGKYSEAILEERQVFEQQVLSTKANSSAGLKS